MSDGDVWRDTREGSLQVDYKKGKSLLLRCIIDQA